MEKKFTEKKQVKSNYMKSLENKLQRSGVKSQSYIKNLIDSYDEQ